MGIGWPQEVSTKLTCDGLHYGEHGYSTTRCLKISRGHMKTTAKRSEVSVSLLEGAQDTGWTKFKYVLDTMPRNWAYIQSGFVCPGCLKEAFKVGIP